MKLVSDFDDQPPGIDLHVWDSDVPVAVFAAYIQGAALTPGGDAKLHLGIPFAQIPRVVPVMQHVGGVVFEVTVRRVAPEDLPEPGWSNGA